ncbi:MAG TPA: hypothetical protein PLS69_02575, partial [Terricaulis sp.]|nr:hypothetical protein [Terricaulis sp.]
MAKIIQVARFTADGTQVERTFKGMGDAGQQMSQRIERGAKSIPPAMRAVDASAGVAKQKIDGLASSTGSLGTVLQSIGPIGIAAAAAIGGLTLAYGALSTATRGAVQQLGAIDVSARRLGVSTDALQEYRFAAIGAGQAGEQADAAITGFNERLGEALIKRQGAGYETLTGPLGFTPEQVANMRETEEVLPLVIERIAQLGTEAEQLRAAKELGLEPFLAVIQQGPGAFDAAAKAAREMGYVIDKELLERAAEFSGRWSQASEVIDVQFKSALVDLAPTFIFLADQIGVATTALVGFIDRFRELEERSTKTLERNAREALQGQVDLTRRHGGGVWQGGDAARGERLLSEFETLPGLGGVPHATTRHAIRSDQDAADMYAALTQRRNTILAELSSRESRNAAGNSGAAPGSLGGGVTSGADPMAQARAWIQTLDDERRTREELMRITSAHAGISREEAEAIRVLERDLARLNELRAAGVIASDDELRALSATVQARYDDAAAARRQAEAQRALAQLKQEDTQRRSNVASFEQAQETPRERMLREIREAEAMRQQGASDETVDRRIASITRAYGDMAAAQLRSSEAGWAI